MGHLTEEQYPDDLMEIAQKTLDMEVDDVPDFYLCPLAEFLLQCPEDTNFILEFGDHKKPEVGGLGFGVVTCLEDSCWQDITLDRNLEREDGGKEDGLGSFYNYQMHCQNDAKHQKGREARLLRSGKRCNLLDGLSPSPVLRSPVVRTHTVPSSSTSLRSFVDDPMPLPRSQIHLTPKLESSQDRDNNSQSRFLSSPIASRPIAAIHAGDRKPSNSSRHAEYVDSFASEGTSTPIGGVSSKALQPSHSLNLPDSHKLRASNSAQTLGKSSSSILQGSQNEPIEINSDSDDEVQVVPPSQVPVALRKVTNQSNPYELSDDEDDEARLPSSSHRNDTSSQSKNIPIAPIFTRTERSSSSNPFNRSAISKPLQAIPGAGVSQSIERSEDDEALDPEAYRALLRGEDSTLDAQVERLRTQEKKDPHPSLSVPTSWYHEEYRRALGQLTVHPQRTLDRTMNELPFGMRVRIANEELSAVKLAMLRLGPATGKRSKALSEREKELETVIFGTKKDRWVSPSVTVLRLVPGLKPIWDKHLGHPYSFSAPILNESLTAGPSTLQRIVHGIAGAVNSFSSSALQNNAIAGPSRASNTDLDRPGYATALHHNTFGGHPHLGSFPTYTHAPYNPLARPLYYPPSSLSMPGALPMPGSYGDLINPYMPSINDDSDWGYEMDRPHSAEGLTTLFQTALDDFQEDVKVEEALEGLGMEKLDSQMDGMNITLMPHQVIGVHWMVQQERKARFKGGILGDEMGLGKTVQAIATMVQNPSEDRKIRTTLIVLPLPLLQQWKAEIESKSGLTCIVYHGPNRTKSVNQLRNVDCVLTTYSILVTEGSDLIPKPKKKKKQDDFVSDDEEDIPVPLKKKGALYKIAWYRIILDEAANIRNKATKASRVVQELVGEIRWCLTGTLIYNNLTDIFPLLRFVGIIDWEDFRNRVHSIAARKPRLAARRSQALLRRVMLRRTKESELNGKKILQLPPKEIEMVELDFTDEERAIYNAVENAARVKVNSWYRSGTILKHYHVVLVMLTRLRQLCCHPYLLRASGEALAHMQAVPVEDDDENGESFANTIVETEDDKTEVERAVRLMGQEWVDKVRHKLEERHRIMLDDKAEAEENEFSCAVCLEPFTQERLTPCHHSFCTQCIQDVLNAPIRDATGMTDEQVTRQARLCPLCRSEVTRDKLFRADAFFKPENVKAELEDVKPMTGLLDGWLKGDMCKGKKRMAEEDEKPEIKKVKSEKRKGKAKASDLDELDDTDEEPEPIEGEEAEMGMEDVKPSTKMKRIGDILDMWREVDPTQKTLIFSSFVEMLELMAQFLKRRGIKYVLYTGKLRPGERDDAIKEFTNKADGSPTVMLISLKCGGVGLNLTAANTVIGLDLAWSPASESQAIDRAHRIGQTRNVSVKRLIIRDSVEGRILALQQKKQALADGAMGEGDSGRLGRLTAHELVRLFGHDEGDE